MNNEIEPSKRIPGKAIPVAPSKMFTYPTRLAGAWEARIMEINLPAYQLDRPGLEISIRQDSTQSLGIQPSNTFRKVYKRFAAPIRMDDEYIYDSRYEVDGNIAHLIVNVAARMLMAKPICPKMTVLFRAKASNMAKNIFKLLEFPVLCTDKDVYGKLVITSDNATGAYEGFYSSLFGDLAFEGYNKQTPERVFISRKGTRSLINEDEVEQTLQEYGFKKFYFEDIPISEQWSVTKNAKALVAMHGAALSSLVFNRNAVKLVELFHPGYVADMYRHITNAIGGTWCGITGQITEDVIRELDFKQNARSFALSPTKIDITSLRMALDHLEVK